MSLSDVVGLDKKVMFTLFWKILKQILGVRFWLSVLLILGYILDLSTTLPIAQLESNPVYFVGGIWLLVAVKTLGIGYAIWLLYGYIHKRNVNIRFLMLSATVLIIFIQFIAAVNNFLVFQSIPEPGLVAGHVTPVEQLSAVVSYFKFMGLLYFFPLIVSFSTFRIYKKFNKEVGLDG